MASEWATSADIKRASSPEEAARALDWQSEQTEIAAHRVAILEMLRGSDPMRKALEERWAALKADPGDTRKRKVVEL